MKTARGKLFGESLGRCPKPTFRAGILAAVGMACRRPLPAKWLPRRAQHNTCPHEAMMCWTPDRTQEPFGNPRTCCVQGPKTLKRFSSRGATDRAGKEAL